VPRSAAAFVAKGLDLGAQRGQVVAQRCDLVAKQADVLCKRRRIAWRAVSGRSLRICCVP